MDHHPADGSLQGPRPKILLTFVDSCRGGGSQIGFASSYVGVCRGLGLQGALRKPLILHQGPFSALATKPLSLGRCTKFDRAIKSFTDLSAKLPGLTSKFFESLTRRIAMIQPRIDRQRNFPLSWGGGRR